MKKIQIALQVFSIRDEAERDFEKSMEQVKKMGYAGVELALCHYRMQLCGYPLSSGGMPLWRKEVRQGYGKYTDHSKGMP